MTHVPLSVAAELLVAESAVEMAAENGDLIEVWTISSLETAVEATAPRLQVHAGMVLTARLSVGGIPHLVVTAVDSAEYRSETRASIRLHVLESEPVGRRRQQQRIPLTPIPAMLTAISCDRLMDSHQIRATVADVSQSGLGLCCDDIRVRPGDLLGVHCRFFEGTLEDDVRIVNVRPLAHSELVVGTVFAKPSAATQTLIEHILTRLRGNHAD